MASVRAAIVLHDDHHFLPNVLKSLVPKVEVSVFVSKIPWHGGPGNWGASVLCAEGAGAEVVVGDWPDEAAHRAAALAHLEEQGCTHALALDSDEIPEPRLLDTLLALAEGDLADVVRCRMDTYWSDACHLVRPRENLFPVVMVKLGAVEHVRIRDYRGERELLLSEGHGILHHLSYAGGDERIRRKITTWSHKDELVPGWWERSWLGWKEDPLLRNLHPTHPGAYGWIERIPLPDFLREAGLEGPQGEVHPPGKWPKVSIVLPLYGGEEDIEHCLRSLEKCRDLLHEVFVVDDVSPDRAADVAERFNFVKVLRNAENLGFAGSCNRGYWESSGDVVVFLNSDTLVPRAGLIRLVESLIESGSIGAAGPVTNNAGYHQPVDPTYTSLSTLDLFAEDLAHSKREDRDVDMLVGFCLAVRRTVLEEVGLFDERFGKGLFEDTDLCYRIIRAGYRLRLASRAYVHHWGSRSLQRMDERPTDVLLRNEKVFHEKWKLDLETGFASHLPGGRENLGLIRFEEDRRPERLLQKIERMREAADVSLTMIVRNEERVLEDCLRTARPFFRQIVVVDTGSSDRTKEIAESYGAEVHEMEWPDSFAKARSESLRHAKGKWVFWLDADDTLPFSSGEKILEAALRAPAGVAGFVVPVQFVEGGPGAGTRVDHVKLFRNVPGLSWEGRIHEQILHSLRPHGEIAALEGAVVLHTGYDTSDAGQARKRERDWKLLGLDLEERPDHPFVLFNIGMTHHFTALPGPGEIFPEDAALPVCLSEGPSHAQAVYWLRRSLSRSESGESHVRKAYALIGGSLRAMGRAEEALSTAEEGLGKAPNDPELIFLKASILSQLGRLHEAEAAYLSMPMSTNGFFSSVDRGILGFKRLHNLAGVRHALGNYRGAKQAWEEALRAAPSHLPSLEGLAEAALEAGDLKTASACSERILAVSGPTESWASLIERLGEESGSGEEALRKACAAFPRAAGPAMALARRLCRSERDREARPMLEGLAEAGVAEAAFFLGVSHTRRRDFAGALAWMKRTLELDPSSEDARSQVRALEAALADCSDLQ